MNLSLIIVGQAQPAAPENRLPEYGMLITIVLLIAAVAWLLYDRLSSSSSQKMKMSEEDLRHFVAKSVLISAIWGLVVVAGLAILMPTAKATSAKDILTLLLPVFGTWVGTLLAYYFGKDNYESGARNSEKMARAVGGLEKLRSIAASTKMVALGAIERPDSWKDKWPADFGKVVLKNLVTEMKRQRLPLLDVVTGSAVAMVHKSLITEFLLKQGVDAEAKFKKENPGAKVEDIAKAGTDAMSAATLKDLLDDKNGHFAKTAKKSFVTVPITATLAEVKEQMDQQSRATDVKCEDAFLVASGSIRVEGWITNDIIQDNSQA